MPRARKANNDYMSNGINISPSVLTSGESVKVQYDGLLAKNGANHIYAHVGFGTTWDRKSYVKMKKAITCFEASIPVVDSDTLNLCFKDCANNWDNNSGKNYTFDVTQ